MRSFLVEVYVGRRGRRAIESLAHDAEAAALAAPAVRYLGSLVLTEDEVCFHVFEAPSLDSVVDASDRRGLDRDRVVETIWIAPRLRADLEASSSP